MIKTPFTDQCGPAVVPKTGAHSSSSEPNLPSGMPGRTGGLLPEKIRDTAISQVPKWVEVNKTDQ